MAGAVAWLAVFAACQVPGTPPVPPSKIVLQHGDLPGALQRCPASGDIDSYLEHLGAVPAQTELQAAWQELRRQGAEEAAAAVYAAQTTACSARLGTGDGTNVSSIVVRFRDGGGAAAAYQRGMLGFTTPSEDAEVSGMTRGAATGIGQNSWVLERSAQGRSLIVGLWQRDDFVALFVAVDEDPLNAKRAMSAVDGRIP